MKAKARKLPEPLIFPLLNLKKMKKTGSILLLALWSLCLLGVFSVYLGYGARQKIFLVQRLNSRDSLYFIADAGLKQAIKEIRNDSILEQDSLNEDFYNNQSVFKDREVGLGKFSVSNIYPDNKELILKTNYGVIDEERKLNLNNAELEDIQRLIEIVSGFEDIDARGLAASIVDWRDEDSELSIPLGSAEDRFYRNLANPYEAKDGNLQVFDELLMVRGMTREILDKLKNYITIYGNGNLNINTATREVLLALGLNEYLVGKIIDFRVGEDAIEATFDDNIFVAPSAITADLSQFTSLSPSEIADLSNLVASGMLATRSDHFRAEIQAQLGKSKLQLIGVFNREGKIISWQEG